VMPAGAGQEAGAGGPAMPELFAVGRGIALVAEDEADVGQAVSFAQAEAPVLVVMREAGASGAAFADDVGVLAVAECVALYPGFQAEVVAFLESELMISVGNAQTGARLVEGDGVIAGDELWVFRRAGPFGDFRAAREQRLGGIGIGGPVVDWFVLRDEFVVAFSEGGSAEEETEGKAKEQVHGRDSVTGDYRRHAFWWGIFY
jgi:hypothetical protein